MPLARMMTITIIINQGRFLPAPLGAHNDLEKTTPPQPSFPSASHPPLLLPPSSPLSPGCLTDRPEPPPGRKGHTLSCHHHFYLYHHLPSLSLTILHPCPPRTVHGPTLQSGVFLKPTHISILHGGITEHNAAYANGWESKGHTAGGDSPGETNIIFKRRP